MAKFLAECSKDYDAFFHKWEHGNVYFFCPVLGGYQVCLEPGKPWDHVQRLDVLFFNDKDFNEYFKEMC